MASELTKKEIEVSGSLFVPVRILGVLYGIGYILKYHVCI